MKGLMFPDAYQKRPTKRFGRKAFELDSYSKNKKNITLRKELAIQNGFRVRVIKRKGRYLLFRRLEK